MQKQGGGLGGGETALDNPRVTNNVAGPPATSILKDAGHDIFHWLRASRIKSTATSTMPIFCRNSSRRRFISSRARRISTGSRTPPEARASVC